ncbi:MAG: CDP-alcohol phosphatidyltransferase family protein [Phytoplasma sp.]|uniref:CDP-alcohol phosphatidyltransferase family protein n=1 Tax=Phytoplasma sp. TaxID=2155 RepID=UPI002B40B77C|nr:CDP-alcohol phosphatidyltransferase family protein [Phytoplasma sp.]WRH06880.1 MAG: CDP-alcohol phosphatidyltransferase family protein [Phytoplasma sp.]
MKKITKISANLITLFRIFLVFFMLPFLFIKSKNNPSDNQLRIYFVFIFLLASLTDFLDGYIAKKFQQQTVFGKFFDPIADKLLIIVSFFYIYILCENNKLLSENSSVLNIKNMVLSVLLINIIRDFLIMGVRLMAFEQKTIITASFLGKLKTIFTFASILFILLSQQIKNITYLEEITLIYTMKIILIINIFLVISSGAHYIIKNFKFITKNF